MAVDIEQYSDVTFSEDKRHRLALHRIWKLNEEKNKILFIGVNPSRGHQFYSDATIIRCTDFATRWGYDGMYFGNLYTLRTPDPKELKANLKDAIDTMANWNLLCMARESRTIVYCWGAYKFIDKRVGEVTRLLKDEDTYCFGYTQDGHPLHPLYLSKRSQLIPYG